MGDKDSGVLGLFHQEHYISTKRHDLSSGMEVVKQKHVTKFMNNIVPRVMLIPSISEETGPVLDYALIKSPAPNILVSLKPVHLVLNTFFTLLTLHCLLCSALVRSSW